MNNDAIVEILVMDNTPEYCKAQGCGVKLCHFEEELLCTVDVGAHEIFLKPAGGGHRDILAHYLGKTEVWRREAQGYNMIYQGD